MAGREVEVLDRPRRSVGAPERIAIDNGPEFVAAEGEGDELGAR
jgi:hypothetical protein